MLQVSSSCNISIYIFNSICWSFLKKFFTQGPHCSHRSFTYNLVDGKHLKLLWQVFSHCFCWSDLKKKKAESQKTVWRIEIPQNQFEAPFWNENCYKEAFWNEVMMGWTVFEMKIQFSKANVFVWWGLYTLCFNLFIIIIVFEIIFSHHPHNGPRKPRREPVETLCVFLVNYFNIFLRIRIY